MSAKSVREGAGTSARGRRAEHECRRGAPLHFLDRVGVPGYPPGNSSQEEISRLSPGSGLPDGWGGWVQRKRRGFSSRSVWVAHKKHPLGLGTARRLLLMDNP